MRRARRARVGVGLLAAALFALSASACGKMGPPGAEGKGPGGKPAEEEEKASPVRVAELTRGDMLATISASSTIEAERAVTVHAESMGRVTKVLYEEGDMVQGGKLMAKIEADAQSIGVNRAAANYDKAEADLERVRRLVASGVASQEELANAEAALRTATIEQKDRRRDLRNTSVNAPFTGTVTERLVNEGAFVNAGQQLYAITDFDTLVARVYVPERELDRIRKGQPAEVIGKAAAGRQGKGVVARIAPTVDAATGTVKLTITLPPELAGGENGFLPGMYAEVTLTTEKHENVLLAPKAALIYEEERVFAFVVDGERAQRVLLETGLSNADQVEILGGLEPGQKIIVAGQDGLKDGALIEVITGDDFKMGAPPAASGKEGAPGEAPGGGEAKGDEENPDEVAKADGAGKGK